jgi:hypothetical protein
VKRHGEMKMEPTPISTTGLHLLSELLDVRAPGAHAWPEADLRAMLDHLLAAPLTLALGMRPGRVEPLLRRENLASDFTLGALYEHPSPPASLLKVVKDAAKSGANDPWHSLPADLLLVVYYSVVALARVRGVGGVSAIKPEALERGLRWGAGLGWVNARLRALLEEALRRR